VGPNPSRHSHAVVLHGEGVLERTATDQTPWFCFSESREVVSRCAECCDGRHPRRAQQNKEHALILQREPACRIILMTAACQPASLPACQPGSLPACQPALSRQAELSEASRWLPSKSSKQSSSIRSSFFTGLFVLSYW
jgi:hypothetical protein